MLKFIFMPELPEVETIKRDLLEKVIGAQIVEVKYTGEGQKLISKSGQDLSQFLPGKRIEKVERKAKFLVFHLSDSRKLVIHLKLTGRLLVREAGHPFDEFTRVIFILEDGREIRFADRNGFGDVNLANEVEEVAPDPFEISVQGFNLAINSSPKETIKETLLDQSKVSGIGNIYADEALYGAGINPFRSPKALSLNETTKLLEEVKIALEEGIKHRGTTIDSFLDTAGIPGTHQNFLKVYGRTGKLCQKCGNRIEYTEIKGRRTHFCPHCQPKDQLSFF